MDNREQIAEALLTGVRAVDALTPIGRGQAQLVAGPVGSGKSQLCIDAVVGQVRVSLRLLPHAGMLVLARPRATQRPLVCTPQRVHAAH